MIDIVIPTKHRRKPDGTEYLSDCVASLRADMPDGCANLFLAEGGGGWCRAINEALKQTTNDVLIIDDDALFAPGWYAEMDKWQGDIAGFKLYYPGTTVIQHVGGALRHDWAGVHPAQGTYDCGMYEVPSRQPWVTFAIVRIKRAVLDKLGGMDESLVHYFGDVDYCLRAWKAGFTVCYNPTLGYHHESTTTRLNPNAQANFADAHKKFSKNWASADTIIMLGEVLDASVPQ